MKPQHFPRLLLIASLMVLTFSSGHAQTQELAPVQTIAALDVPRYQGTWYEIAKFPNWFQKKCVANTKAVYSLKPDSTIQVLNSCTLENKQVSTAEGNARQIGAADSPKLKVRFAPAWLSFLPFVWGDYWVIDLDPSYQVAAVSDPQREYLWVLSRTPQLDQKVYEALLIRLKQQQFDIQKLELTSQSADTKRQAN